MNVGPQDTQKLYQQIARTIAAAIEDGRYAPGDRLPSERELADDFGVSRPTIRDAMIALEFQGLVEARQGSGVYVKAALRRARANGRADFVGEHHRIASALRTRDSKAARQAMHGHLAQVIDDLLGLAESDALEQTREKMAEQRRMLGLRTEI